MQHESIIPIFFAVDDGYAPVLGVAIRSLVAVADPGRHYAVHILTDQLSDHHRHQLQSLQSDNVRIEFTDVHDQLVSLQDRLHVRDYYTSATYYRFFIPSLFPQYDCGIYLDCDMVVLTDPAVLCQLPMGNNLLAAVNDEVVVKNDVFAQYVETVLEVPRHRYFNAGMLVMNLQEMRRMDLEKALVQLMGRYTFRVAQDQDYLNLLCKNKVFYLDTKWNKTPYPEDASIVPHIAHYKLNYKPWHYRGVCYEEYFWKHAAMTPYAALLLTQRDSYRADQAANDERQYIALLALAQKETEQAAANKRRGA